MITVTLIRHGQIPANISRSYVGCRTDQPLTDEGERQCSDLAGELPAVDRVFVSPLTRCRQTARIVYPGMEHEVVDDLREMDFGVFEGKAASSLESDAFYREWVESGCTLPIPGGESMEEFDYRCRRGFLRLLASCSDGDRIALVVHGGTVMSIMGSFCDDGRAYFEYHVGNCGYYTCTCPAAGEIRLHRIGGNEPRGAVPPAPDGGAERE